MATPITSLKIHSPSMRSRSSGYMSKCFPNGWEDIQLILTECGVTRPARDAILPKIRELLANAEQSFDWTSFLNNNVLLAQFIIDPCSMSLHLSPELLQTPHQQHSSSRINLPHKRDLFHLSQPAKYCTMCRQNEKFLNNSYLEQLSRHREPCT